MTEIQVKSLMDSTFESMSLLGATKITNTAKKKSHVFLFIHVLLIVSQKRGSSSILLQCVPELACKSVNFLIGQLLISVVDACFSSSEF